MEEDPRVSASLQAEGEKEEREEEKESLSLQNRSAKPVLHQWRPFLPVHHSRPEPAAVHPLVAWGWEALPRRLQREGSFSARRDCCGRPPLLRDC